MRKIIAVLASVLMIVTLAACGKKEEKQILAGRKVLYQTVRLHLQRWSRGKMKVQAPAF